MRPRVWLPDTMKHVLSSTSDGQTSVIVTSSLDMLGVCKVALNIPKKWWTHLDEQISDLLPLGQFLFQDLCISQMFLSKLRPGGKPFHVAEGFLWFYMTNSIFLLTWNSPSTSKQSFTEAFRTLIIPMVSFRERISCWWWPNKTKANRKRTLGPSSRKQSQILSRV